MVGLSAGAHLAWQIAAGETALARQQYIEKEQIFIGICSLEKVLIPGAFKELDPRMMRLRISSEILSWNRQKYAGQSVSILELVITPTKKRWFTEAKPARNTLRTLRK